MFKKTFWLWLIIWISLSPAIAQNKNSGLQLSYQAQTAYQQSQFKDATILWEQAFNAFVTEGDRLNQAMALSNLSLTYQKLGEWDAAKTALDKAWSLLNTKTKNKNELEIVAQTLEIQGHFEKEIGKIEEALNTWTLATNIYTQISNSSKIIQSQINRAQAMQDLGLYPRSCQTLISTFNLDNLVKNCQTLASVNNEKFLEELKKIERNQSSLTTSFGLRSLGNILQSMGQLQKSEIVLTTSINIAKKNNSDRDIANTYVSLGSTYQGLSLSEVTRIKRENYYDKSLEAYDRAIELTDSLITKQKAQQNKLNLLLQIGEWEKAQKLWSDFQNQIDLLPVTRTKIYLQTNLANIFIKLIENDFNNDRFKPLSFAEIDILLGNAIANAQNLEDRQGEAYALQKRGRLYEIAKKEGNLTQAEKLTEQALSLISSFKAPEISYQLFWQLGRIQKKQNRFNEAKSNYEQSVRLLKSLRQDLLVIDKEIQYSFRENVEPVYRNLIELDLKIANSLKKENKQKESVKFIQHALTIFEDLQLAEIHDFFRETCVDAQPKQIDLIDRNAAVIYPIILEDRLEIVLDLPDREPTVHTTLVKRKDLENTIDTIHQSLISSTSDLNAALKYYQQLYNWTIAPLEKELTTTQLKTLVFVLDGNLRNIPMSVLHDGNQYLVQKYAIALTPGLQLLNPKPFKEVQLTVLTAGLSKMPVNSEAHKDFNDLPYVKEEIEEIEKLGISKESLLDEEFTTQKLQKDESKFRFPLVHLATHGKFSSKLEDTFILAWDRRIGILELDKLLKDRTFNNSQPIELLVISACETAAGDNRAALGLAGVAVKAGARSTLASLWRVSDKSTAKLMINFYARLKEVEINQINKAQALTEAQKELLADKDFSHPYFWAPFVLVGNWQ
jgi:CHAT domain-containing protein